MKRITLSSPPSRWLIVNSSWLKSFTDAFDFNKCEFKCNKLSSFFKIYKLNNRDNKSDEKTINVIKLMLLNASYECKQVFYNLHTLFK